MQEFIAAINLRILVIAGLMVAIGLILFRVMVVPMLWRRKTLRYGAKCPSLPLVALPKEFDRTVLQVSPQSWRTHHVNLYQTSCTCRRFRSFRGFFQKSDIRRLCRHLRRELEATGTITLLDEVTQRIVKDQVRDRCYRQMSVAGVDFVIGYHPRSDFVRVFTRRKNEDDPADGPYTGVYDKFVLHLSQELWIYGEAPPGAVVIIRAIAEVMAGFKIHKVGKAILEPSEPPLD